jgi:uncharacterized protein (TIGR02246 family)
MRRLVLLLALVLLAGPAFAQARITDADVRAFAARQERAWNAGDLAAYFAGFTPDARFTDQAYVGDKPPVPYGTSTLAEARAQAARTRGRSREAGEIMRVEIAADGRSARVTARVGSTVTNGGKSRRLCASRMQTLVLANGALRSRGQTDTYIRCRGG